VNAFDGSRRRIRALIVVVAAVILAAMPVGVAARPDQPDGPTPIVLFPAWHFTRLQVTVHNQHTDAACPASGQFEDLVFFDPGPPFSQVCRDELLTPIGLRSLSPQDPRFQPHHRGTSTERDNAYHQGTVWPWLVGPYVDAAVRAGVAIDGALGALDDHLRDGGLGSVSETADAVAPHRPSGCPFQAWSVAEVLRARRRVQQLGG